MVAIVYRDFKVEHTSGDITGGIFYTDRVSKLGVVLGTGILGNRLGLEDIARHLVTNLEVPVITMDPPSHHLNTQEFTFGNYADACAAASKYLRERFVVEKVVGGGHSGGPIAALYASMGYTHEIEQLVIEATSDERKLEAFYNGIGDANRELPFDGLIMASLPHDLRLVMPRIAFTKPVFGIMHWYFTKFQNRDNPTHYLGKNNGRPYQWKHLALADIKVVKNYVQRALNPDELIGIINDADDNLNITERLREIPKLFLVPGKDIANFKGVDFKGVNDPNEKFDRLREIFEVVGFSDNDYHEFPDAAHWLNYVDRTEMDSLWGLKAPRVQELITEFVSRFK